MDSASTVAMQVMTRKRLQEFRQTPPDAERPLKARLAIIGLKRYSGRHEVHQDFAAASFLGNWRTVFNIGGNKYRLVVDLCYDLGRIYNTSQW
jgi:mRNA interferase HigB